MNKFTMDSCHARREIEDQLAQAFDPGDDQWECTWECCAWEIPGLGLVPKRGHWLFEVQVNKPGGGVS